MPDSTLDSTPVDSDDQRAIIRQLTAALPADVRRFRAEVLAETLADGVPVDPAALTVVLAAHLDSADVALEFTSEHVAELLWFAIIGFCDDCDIAVPDGCTRALHALLATLVRSGQLAAGTSARPLFAPFDELGSLAAAG